jgi:hypothetical protein
MRRCSLGLWRGEEMLSGALEFTRRREEGERERRLLVSGS